MNTDNLSKLINELYSSTDSAFVAKHKSSIDEVIDLLDTGHLCVVSSNSTSDPHQNSWSVNEWVKKAILLYFRTQNLETIENPPFSFVDKIPLKKWTGKEGVRVVPHALVRKGAFIHPGVILMPSYVNIGATVGSGSMIDTWATVGSCAYVGKNVHVSGGVGLGGVLEPLQAKPVIIEDNAFLGSRAILVEGVHVGAGAVIAAGVTITGSTKIIDVSQSSPKEYKGYVPPRSVVIPGTITKTFAAGNYGVPCALIIGERKESTDLKTSLNDALRTFEVPV